jgi:hypothetical protein
MPHGCQISTWIERETKYQDDNGKRDEYSIAKTRSCLWFLVRLSSSLLVSSVSEQTQAVFVVQHNALLSFVQ